MGTNELNQYLNTAKYRCQSIYRYPDTNFYRLRTICFTFGRQRLICYILWSLFQLLAALFKLFGLGLQAKSCLVVQALTKRPLCNIGVFSQYIIEHNVLPTYSFISTSFKNGTSNPRRWVSWKKTRIGKGTPNSKWRPENPHSKPPP